MITLILGSGGAKGMAHIGVLKRLEELNIKPEHIIGSSIGAVIGAMYCKGLNAKDIEKLFLKLNTYKLLDLQGFNPGLMSGKKVKIFLEENIPKKFSDLKIPLTINSLDINSGKEVVLNEGNLIESVLSSMSIPGLFKPVKIKNKNLIDIGFINPVPLNLINEDKTTHVIVSDVSSHVDILKSYSTLNILKQCFSITLRNSAERSIKEHRKKSHIKTYYIISEVGHYNIFDFIKKQTNLEKIIEEGYKKAKKSNLSDIFIK